MNNYIPAGGKFTEVNTGVNNDKRVDDGIIASGTTFIKSLLDLGAEGIEKAPVRIIEQRLKICRNCTKEPTCPECGCYIDSKVKLRGSSCPVDKWKPFNEGENITEYINNNN